MKASSAREKRICCGKKVIAAAATSPMRVSFSKKAPWAKSTAGIKVA